MRPPSRDGAYQPVQGRLSINPPNRSMKWSLPTPIPITTTRAGMHKINTSNGGPSERFNMGSFMGIHKFNDGRDDKRIKIPLPSSVYLCTTAHRGRLTPHQKLPVPSRTAIHKYQLKSASLIIMSGIGSFMSVPSSEERLLNRPVEDTANFHYDHDCPGTKIAAHRYWTLFANILRPSRNPQE